MSLYKAGLATYGGPSVSVGDLRPPEESHPGTTLAVIGVGLLAIFVGIPAVRKSRLPRATARTRSHDQYALPDMPGRLRPRWAGDPYTHGREGFRYSMGPHRRYLK